jgi:hypothetical protein
MTSQSVAIRGALIGAARADQPRIALGRPKGDQGPMFLHSCWLGQAAIVGRGAQLTNLLEEPINLPFFKLANKNGLPSDLTNLLYVYKDTWGAPTATLPQTAHIAQYKSRFLVG